MSEFLPIFIEQTALQVMQEDALRSFPDECCGFFFGVEQDRRMVHSATPVVNSREGDKRRRFSISPDDYRRAELHALTSGIQLLGVYHSHPLHPAVPSEHDLAAAMPWFSYIILSVEPQGIVSVRSWQLNAQNRFSEEIMILPQP